MGNAAILFRNNIIDAAQKRSPMGFLFLVQNVGLMHQSHMSSRYDFPHMQMQMQMKIKYAGELSSSLMMTTMGAIFSYM